MLGTEGEGRGGRPRGCGLTAHGPCRRSRSRLAEDRVSRCQGRSGQHRGATGPGASRGCRVQEASAPRTEADAGAERAEAAEKAVALACRCLLCQLVSSVEWSRVAVSGDRARLGHDRGKLRRPCREQKHLATSKCARPRKGLLLQRLRVQPF